jgi:hypothetical protein
MHNHLNKLAICWLALAFQAPAMAENVETLDASDVVVIADQAVAVEPTIELVDPETEPEPDFDLQELVKRAQLSGLGKLIEQDGRAYYSLKGKAENGEAYTSYYPIRGGKLAARVIVLRDGLAEKPGCHVAADTCLTVRFSADEAEVSFNLKGESHSYAYSGQSGKESAYFSPVAGAPAVNLNELASDLYAHGALMLNAWAPLPESRIENLASADLSNLGLHVGQNGISLTNALGVDPSAFVGAESGLILNEGRPWKFGQIDARLSALTTYLDFDEQGGLSKAVLAGSTASSQVEADATCAALSSDFGLPVAALIQKSEAGAYAVELHSWWWLDASSAGLLRCTTVDTSRLGGEEKTLVGYTLSKPEGNFAPLFLDRPPLASVKVEGLDDRIELP